MDQPHDTPPSRPMAMWEVPRRYRVQRRNSALIEIFKFSIYCAFPLGCMIYFGGPDFYNKHVKPNVADYTLGIWKDSPKVNPRMPQSREELDEMIEEMRSSKRESALLDEAEERHYSKPSPTSNPYAVADPKPPSNVRHDTNLRLV